MFWPTTVPEREELVTRDEKGVAQPTVKEIKQSWGVLPLVRGLFGV